MTAYTFTEAFQERILAFLLQDPVFLAEFHDVINPTYFVSETVQALVEIATEHFEQYQKIPDRETYLELIRQYVEKFSLDDDEYKLLRKTARDAYSRDVADATFIREQVVEFGKWQAAKQAIISSAELIDRTQDEDVDTIRDGIVQKVQQALLVGTGFDMGVNVFDHIDAPRQYIESDDIFSAARKVPTGIEMLDASLRGGPGAGELGVVAGESGVGKSILLTQFAAYASKKGHRVIYFSLELKPPDIVLRGLANFTCLPYEDVLDETPAYFERVKKWKTYGSQYFSVKYFAPGEASVGTLRSYISRYTAKHKHSPNLIVVDYADELRVDKVWQDNTYLGFGQVYSELIALGKDYRCPVWTASQINRAGYGQERPGRNTLSDSNKKLSKADVVLFIAQTEEEQEQGRARLIIDKARRGVKYHIPVRMLLDRCTVRPLSQDEIAEEKKREEDDADSRKKGRRRNG